VVFQGRRNGFLSFPPPFPLCSSSFCFFTYRFCLPPLLLFLFPLKHTNSGCSLPLTHCRHASHHRPFLGFEVAYKSDSFKALSMSSCQSCPQTRPTIVLQDLPASRRLSPSYHLVTTCRRMASTRLLVDLTCS
jgi:hypothetical protein